MRTLEVFLAILGGGGGGAARKKSFGLRDAGAGSSAAVLSPSPGRKRLCQPKNTDGYDVLCAFLFGLDRATKYHSEELQSITLARDARGTNASIMK